MSDSISAADTSLTPRDLRVSFEDLPDFSHIAKMWLDLERRSSCSFFQSWGWISTWLQQLPRGVQPKILVAYDDSIAVGLGVLIAESHLRNGFTRSNGLYVSETGMPRLDRLTIEYNGILVQREFPDQILRPCIEWLRDNDSTWDELHMSGLSEGDRDTYERIAVALGLRVLVRDEKPCIYVDMDTVRQKGGDYLETLSRNTRYQIRRSLRRYGAHGRPVLEVADDTDQALRFLTELKELHQAYWQRRGHPGAFSSPFFEQFHRSLIINRHDEGEIQLMRISAGKRLIGYLYNFSYKGWVYAYQSGFNFDSDPKLKPGLVSHYLAIHYNLGLETRAYDFMAGEGQHKRSLGTHASNMTWLVLQRDLAKFRLENALRSCRKWLRGEGMD